MSRQAILYTRQGCHLCEQAHEMLTRHGVVVQTIDIDSDPALRERYDVWVPVVTIDGQERFRGRIDQRCCADCCTRGDLPSRMRKLPGDSANAATAARDASRSRVSSSLARHPEANASYSQKSSRHSVI